MSYSFIATLELCIWKNINNVKHVLFFVINGCQNRCLKLNHVRDVLCGWVKLVNRHKLTSQPTYLQRLTMKVSAEPGPTIYNENRSHNSDEDFWCQTVERGHITPYSVEPARILYAHWNGDFWAYIMRQLHHDDAENLAPGSWQGWTLPQVFTWQKHTQKASVVDFCHQEYSPIMIN